MTNFNEKLIIANALKTSFNSAKRELIEETFWGDENIIEKVRKAQDEYELFTKIIEQLKAEDLIRYKAEFLKL
tara:strand:- start:908 stop:1126 length:219 start_codon:yes stop_codon:yes gene_type:complete